MTIAMAETALARLLQLMDKEDWEQLVGMLADEVELADELTATWLRGRDRVAAYLRAQTGVVTDIHSNASDTAARRLGGDDVLVTFNLRQRYRLDGAERVEHTTGCAIFRNEGDQPVLTLLHLGETAHADDADGDFVQTTPDEPEAVGERIRALREATGLSLRALATASKLSASFLSQVERSQVDPSVSSLRRVAAADSAPPRKRSSRASTNIPRCAPGAQTSGRARRCPSWACPSRRSRVSREDASAPGLR